jgi:hypothetical protein
MMSQILDLRGTTKEIEDSHLQGSSRESYTCTLVLLFMYLYDSERKAVAFAEETLEIFEAANNKDNLNEDRPNLREAVKEVIRDLGIEPSPPLFQGKQGEAEIRNRETMKKMLLRYGNAAA